MNRLKEIKIIIIGFGSIGQRHYKNLFKLGFKNVSVYDVDKKKTNSPSIKKLDNIRLPTLKQFDIAFICSPNHLHIKQAIQAAKAGCHLFIEKPLSHNLKGVKELANICHEKKLTNMVACNMRFESCLQFIKKYTAKAKLGKIHGIHLEFGYYLPYWRKEQDYRKNYGAKKKTGGGIILDDIHEFDLLFWLNDFKPVAEAKLIRGKTSDLQIETEDIAIAAFKFKNQVLGSVRCDYLQQAYTRNCKIIGERGNLKWDFNENIVWLYTKTGSKKLFQAKKYNTNQMFLDQLKYFFNCLQNKKPTFNNLKTAQMVLKEVLKH